jgi:rhamnosyltransferase
MKKNILAVIPIYFPSENLLYNINSFINNIDFLIIVNNSSSDITFCTNTLPKNKILIYNPGSNIGISKSYNFSIRFAQQNNFDYLLIMDQDSSFVNDSFWTLLNQLDNNDNIALVSAATSNDRSDFCNNYNHVFYHRKILMSSGTVIFLNVISKVGLFDENLFIDEVDHDFSLRCHLKGFLNLTTFETHIRHSVGECYFCSFPMNYFKKKIILHKPFRYYYIFKNGRYMIKKYIFKDFTFSFKRFYYLLKLFFKILFFYPTKLKYFKFIILSFIK